MQKKSAGEHSDCYLRSKLFVFLLRCLDKMMLLSRFHFLLQPVLWVYLLLVVGASGGSGLLLVVSGRFCYMWSEPMECSAIYVVRAVGGPVCYMWSELSVC